MTARPRAAHLLAALLLAPAPLPAARGAESVTLTTGDGAKLAARYYPSAQPGGKSPAVIVLDDTGGDARPAACDDIARQLAKEGCTVLCFDFRGHGRSQNVEPEFWDDPNNRRLVKGYKSDDPPETIRYADFKPGYLPALVNDVAAARAYLERRNDARECNTAQMYLIGYGRGATLGQLWLAAEWARYRVSGVQSKVSTRPEGRDVAGCVWVGPRFALDRQPVPMLDLLKRAEAKRSTLVALIHDPNDTEGVRFAQQCEEALNVKGKGPLVATRAVARESRSAGGPGEVAERVGTFIADMRKVQELPPWDDRDFSDRRFVWSFRGAPLITAKDEDDYHFQPVPVDQVLGGKR